MGITFKTIVVYNNKHFELNIMINKYSRTYNIFWVYHKYLCRNTKFFF